MGSLYNMIMGTNPYAAALLHLLHFDDPVQIPRLRDAYVDSDNNIVIFTRTGGPNREDYEQGNLILTQHECYLRTEDWDTDYTFAKWVFRPPTGLEQTVADMAKGGAFMDPTKAFADMMEQLSRPHQTPEAKAAIERAMPMVKAVGERLMQGTGPVILLDDDHKLTAGVDYDS